MSRGPVSWPVPRWPGPEDRRAGLLQDGALDVDCVERQPARRARDAGERCDLRDGIVFEAQLGCGDEVVPGELRPRLAEVPQPEAARSVLLPERRRSSSESCGKPPPPALVSKLIGRVTVMSVPTPVSGLSTSSCARSSPADSAVVVTTSPTPSARPSAVRIVRPLRRRSSLKT